MPKHRLPFRRRAVLWLRADLAEMRKVPDNVRTMRRHPMIVAGAFAVTVCMIIPINAFLALIGKPEWFSVVYGLVAIPVGTVVLGRAFVARQPSGD